MMRSEALMSDKRDFRARCIYILVSQASYYTPLFLRFPRYHESTYISENDYKEMAYDSRDHVS